MRSAPLLLAVALATSVPVLGSDPSPGSVPPLGSVPSAGTEVTTRPGWWMGSAVNAADLSRELERFAAD
jgi:hypothetical protein